MNNIGKINILGVDYTIYTHRDYKALNEMERNLDKEYDLNFKEDQAWRNVMGFCNVVTKEIHVYTEVSTDYYNNTFCHELWHALLYEIGYAHWNDEEFIDKLAGWFPRMEEIMKNLHGLKENIKTKDCEPADFDEMVQKEEKKNA